MLRQVAHAAAAIVILAAIGGWTKMATAQGCHGGGHQGGSHASHGASSARTAHSHGGPVQQRGPRVASILEVAPHGGQVSMAGTIYFVEVVYEPLETRVYLYDALQKPMSSRGVQGQLLMRPRDADRDHVFLLTYVAAPANSREMDYLAAAVDVRSIRDGDMTVAVELQKLPHRQYPGATVKQEFALSHVPAMINVAAVNDSDQPGIARQGRCPVTGEPLGDHGTPVKLLIGSQTLYLCCRACIDEVISAPERFEVSGSLSQSQVQ